jgi:ribose 5-phosphate isomerase RpiB
MSLNFLDFEQLNAEFEGGRHQTRVEAIAAIEQAKN